MCVNENIVQAANWVHREGANPPDFHIGRADGIEAYNRHTYMKTFFITGTLFTAFLYHLGLFALNCRRAATFLFG